MAQGCFLGRTLQMNNCKTICSQSFYLGAYEERIRPKRGILNLCFQLKNWLLVVLGFNASLTAKVISWRSITHMCFLAFLHQCKHKFLSKATDYFSQMLQQRWEAKIHWKESSPQPGIKLTTTRSGVQHAHNCRLSQQGGVQLKDNTVFLNQNCE